MEKPEKFTSRSSSSFPPERAFPSNEQTESLQRKRVNTEKYGEYERFPPTGGKRKRRKMREREGGRADWLKRDSPTGKESPLFQVNRETRSHRRRRRMILTGRGVVLRQATGSRYRARVLANSTVFQRATSYTTTRLLVGRSVGRRRRRRRRKPGPQSHGVNAAGVRNRIRRFEPPCTLEPPIPSTYTRASVINH